MTRPALITSALAVFLSTPLSAQDLSLALPIDCTLGESCFIQQYPDRDPGPGARDYTCGPLSYDTHSGTDFRLPTLAEMEDGTAVRAAAPGIIRATRDAWPDISIRDPNAPDLQGQDCGNGVVITHPGGWETQYCHLRRGSIAVREGDQVNTGDTLGLVGLSGRTEFPHLDFSLRRNSEEVDPFAPKNLTSCGVPSPGSLWDTPLPYQPGGFLDAGFLDAVPQYDAIQNGLHSPATLQSPGALVLWGFLFGGRAGDVVSFEITGPDGWAHSDSATLDRTQAQLFRASGRRAPEAGLPKGPYSGRIELLRDGTAIDETELSVTLD